MELASDESVVKRLTEAFRDALLAALEPASRCSPKGRVRRHEPSSSFYTLEFTDFGVSIDEQLLADFIDAHANEVRDVRVRFPNLMCVNTETMELNKLSVEIDVWKSDIDESARQRLALNYVHEEHAPKLDFAVRLKDGATARECKQVEAVLVYVQNMSLDMPRSNCDVIVLPETLVVSLGNMTVLRVAWVRALRTWVSDVRASADCHVGRIVFESDPALKIYNELQVELVRVSAAAGNKRKRTTTPLPVSKPPPAAATKVTLPPVLVPITEEDEEQPVKRRPSFFSAFKSKLLG